MTTSRRGRGLLVVTTAVSAATVLAVTAAGGATAAQTAGPGDGKGKAAQSENLFGQGAQGQLRRPDAERQDHHRPRRQGGRQGDRRRRRSSANSLGTQGVVELDPNTGTPAQVTKLNGFLTGKSAKKAQDIALALREGAPRGLQALRRRPGHAEAAQGLRRRPGHPPRVLDPGGRRCRGLRQRPEGQRHQERPADLGDGLAGRRSGLAGPGQVRRGRAEGDRRRGPHRRRRGHRRYGEVRDRRRPPASAPPGATATPPSRCGSTPPTGCARAG